MSSKTLFSFHWLFVFFILLSLSTGLTVSADNPGSWLFEYREYLPDGDVFFWHLVSATLLISLFVGYGFWQIKSGGVKRLSTLFKPVKKRVITQWLQRFSYVLLGVVFVGAAISGVLLYFGKLENTPLKMVHFVMACGFPVFVLLHLVAHYLKGRFAQLWRIFTWRKGYAYFASSVAVTAVSLLLVATVLMWNYRLLPVPLTEQNIEVDGVFDEGVWQQTQAVDVVTAHGANFENGQTRVTVRALRSATHIYFALKWRDPTRSQKHLPLIKTKFGWKALQTDFMRANEDAYYEDKFALMLVPGNPFAALTSIHLGKQPLKGQPSSFGERGLHYTEGRYLDIWHWQSVRSNQHGQADDNYFGPPLAAPPATPRRQKWDGLATYERYTGGYRKDPPTTWSGYSMNWEVFETGLVQPRRLPKEPDDLIVLGDVHLDSNTSDDGQWWFDWDDTKPYMIEHDRYPEGTLLPGVLLNEPRSGDRADIQAYGVWQDGYWYLEMARRLNTGSKFDVEITDDTYLWLAAFDHTQTRHTRHLIPLRITFVAHPLH